jgi:hypothetical protein
MFINITDSETGNNKGSCGALVSYLEKENRTIGDENKNEEMWFNGICRDISPQEVRVKIDNNVSKLGKNDAKFYLINISPSQKEIEFLQKNFGEKAAEEKLKEFTLRVMDEYARNFKRPGVEGNTDLLWYGKLEHYRYYSHMDTEVKEGINKVGTRKEGCQLHVQVIVSRKDITGRLKLSPMNNSRGKNPEHSAKLGQFDRKAFKQAGESLFDSIFNFQRELKDTMNYSVVMKNGSIQQKQQMYISWSYENQTGAGQNINIEGTRNIFPNSNDQGLEQLLDINTDISVELVGSFLLTDAAISRQENIYPTPRKKKKKRHQ